MAETRRIAERATPPMEELLQKYRAMKSSNRIAEKYCVTGRTVRNWMEEYGIPRRVQTPSMEELSAKCETKTLNEIAEEYKVCRETVKYWRRNYGITMTKRLFEKSAQKTPEKTKANFGARNRRKRNYSKIRQERAENNFQTGKNGKRYEQGDETTLERLIDFYNPLFNKDGNAAMKEIFGNIIKKSGSERLVYMALHKHYSKLERASA